MKCLTQQPLDKNILTSTSAKCNPIFEIKKSVKEKPKIIRKKFDKKNTIKIIKKLMPLIGVVLLVYLIIDIGAAKIASTFLKISPIYILLSAILVVPRLLIRNTAWQIILKKQNINVSYLTSLKAFLIGYFYGTVTPGYIGQLMRIPYLKEKTNQPVGKLFINTIIEEAVHTFPIYIFMIVGAFLIAERIPAALPIACIILLADILIYIYFLKKERGEKTLNFLIKILIPKKFKSYFTSFVDTFYHDFPNLKYLIIPFLIAIPEWIMIYSQIYLLGVPLGIEVPYFDFLMLYAIANIISFIPITSAGLGFREGALVVLFGIYNVAPEKAIVISLAGHLVSDVLTGFYGLIISLFETRNKKHNITI